jgi:hypothetical protein
LAPSFTAFSNYWSTVGFARLALKARALAFDEGIERQCPE